MARQMAADTDTSTRPEQPRVIRMHPNDNVAIVVNDFGLPAGTQLPSGPTLRERVPQAHKVALVDIAEGAPVRRYDVVIGYATQALPAGSWVNEQRLVMPTPPAFEGLPIATNNAQLGPALEGYTFEGYRNPDGSVGTRNILAITTTVQCVSGVVEHAVRRIRNELLPKYPHVDDVVGDPTKSLAWYDAYHGVKHNRENEFRRGTLERAFEAVSACIVLLVAQFGSTALIFELSRFVGVRAPVWPIGEMYIPRVLDLDWTPVGHPDLSSNRLIADQEQS
jgi:D-galactarate dehydratase / Altronate hydrolase, C terminus/SAF domain